MLRLPSQQGVKALCKRLRNPLCNPLRNPVHARYVHIEQAPYSGPPSWATITQRFSSRPSPLIYFTNKRDEEARERNEFIDIHDMGGVDPNSYDVLLSDINDNMLRSDVAEIVGIPYLSKATKDDARKMVGIGHGIIYGETGRLIFPTPVSFLDKAYWVFFIVDTGSPLTFISSQAAEVLGVTRNGLAVTIAGREQPVHLSPQRSHFSDINILGCDFCNQHIPYWEVDSISGTVKWYIGKKQWQITPKNP